MYIPYLNASKFQIILKSRKGHPFPYWTQVIAGSLQPFVSTGVTPLGTRHWKKYPSCILLLPYNSASVNYVPIRNHMKKGFAKENIIAKWRKDRCPSRSFVLVCQNDHQDKMGKDVSSQSNFNPKLLIDIYFGDSAFCWWDLVEDGLVVVMIPIIGTQSV